MKIVDFINTFKGTEYKEKLIQKHITKPYMNWLLKVGEAENIVQKSCYDKDGNFRLNSPLRYYIFIVTVIKNYTDLEFEDGDMMHDFNLLEENGIDDMIVGMVEDIARFTKVLQMTLDDHMENYRSLPSYFDSKKDALMTVLDSIQLPENVGVDMEVNQNAKIENN